MTIENSRMALLVVATASVLAGCASAPQSDNPKSPDDVKIYRGSELVPSQYQIVSRLWTDSWRTWRRVPTYAKQEDAIASLRAEAGRIGADGLINVVCLNQQPGAETAMLCYGTAIRLVGKAPA
jgi:uncharacterized protein YbjQ (UPF0145 family)